MRWIIMLLALAGVVAASLAWREHYRIGVSPCAINEKWDCGTVNKSTYAVIGGLFVDSGPDAQPSFLQRKLPAIARIPVAVVGIAGYVLLALLAFKRWWHALAIASVLGLAFSLYLAHVEKDILGVWCIYCVISLCVISLITLLSVVMSIAKLVRRPKAAQA
jgi:vitamin-K-epoxide reductase (warfarin-sensitive)